MARGHKRAVQRYHDRVARRYDASYKDAYWQWHDALTWDYLKPHLPADQIAPVLDLGCGTGKWALRLLKSGYAVTCVDISGGMIEKARQVITESGLGDRAEFLQADLVDLSDLPSGSFSFAAALGEPIGCASAPARALKEIRKRLRPEAMLVATLDNRLAALDFYLEAGSPREMSAFLKAGKTHWLTKDKDERFPIHTYTPAQARGLFERAGYDVVQLLGKTVLPMRHHRQLLEDPVARRSWMKLEKVLARAPDAVGRSGHLQIAARVRPT
jgi:SAM-dependent methyltransferase